MLLLKRLFLKSYDVPDTLRDFSEILCLEVHPTNTFLYSGTAHSAIRCYDLNTLECFTAMHSKDQHNVSDLVVVNVSEQYVVGFFLSILGFFSEWYHWTRVLGERFLSCLLLS